MAPEPDRFYLEVGRRIQGLRGSKRMTQQELGLRLEPPVTRASIANLENGRQRLLLHTLVQIAEILECQLDDLVPSSQLAYKDPATQKEVATELKKANVPFHALNRISRQFMLPTKKGRK